LFHAASVATIWSIAGAGGRARWRVPHDFDPERQLKSALIDAGLAKE